MKNWKKPELIVLDMEQIRKIIGESTMSGGSGDWCFRVGR